MDAYLERVMKMLILIHHENVAILQLHCVSKESIKETEKEWNEVYKKIFEDR